MSATAITSCFDDLLAYLREYHPVTATALGDHSRDGDLDDWSPGSADERLAALDRLRARATAIETADAEVAGDRMLLVNEIDGLRFQLEGLRAHLHNPLGYLDVATSGVYDLLRRDDLPVAPRQAAVAGRAGAVPRLLDQAQATLDGVPAPHRKVALLRISGASELFRDTATRFAPAAGEVAEAAAGACEAFGAWLEETAAEPAPDWRLGEERWPDALRLSLGVDMAAEEVWRRAHDRMEELLAEAEQAAARVLGSGGGGLGGSELIRAGLERIAADAVPRGRLVQRAAGVLPEIRAFLRELDLFELPEPDTLRVEEVPPFAQGVAVAYFQPAPPLEPDAADTYYLSPVPDAWDDTRAASFLREYNEHALKSVGIHEAYPGHYVQLATAGRHPRLLRRALWNAAFVEGWATYVERVVIGAGFGGDRLVLTSAKLALRSVANAILDQGLHMHGWGEAQAMSLMQDEAFQEAEEASGKLIRAQVTAGQLSTYFVGSEEMADLRAAAEAGSGAAFDAKSFHRAVLAHGSPPFAALRAAVLADDAPSGGPA